MSDAKPDGRSRTAPMNGKRGGCPEGTERKGRTKIDPEALIDSAAERLLRDGKLAKVDARLRPPGDVDKKAVQKVLGITADELNQRLSEKMGQISERILARVEEKLEADAVKANELFFGLAVIEDKRARLDGRSTLNAATVNVQVNNFNGDTKDLRKEVFERLKLAKAESVEV
jgi:hypothetical protein